MSWNFKVRNSTAKATMADFAAAVERDLNCRPKHQIQEAARLLADKLDPMVCMQIETYGHVNDDGRSSNISITITTY